MMYIQVFTKLIFFHLVPGVEQEIWMDFCVGSADKNIEILNGSGH